MIIRQAVLRQGERLCTGYCLPSLTYKGRRLAPPNRRVWARRLATPTVDDLEQRLQNSLRETHSIEAQLQEVTEEPIPRIDNESHVSLDPFDNAPVETYNVRRHQAKQIGQLGSKLRKSYVPDSLVDDPPSPANISLSLLLASQAHMGHSTSLWNPMNSRYIFGIRQGIHVISLEATASHLRRACRVVSGVAERGGLILFVGTRKGQERTVIKAAQRAGGCYLFDRWMPGTITNGLQILGFAKLQALDPMDRHIEGFDEELSELPPLKPDLVVCLNPLENYVLLRECGQHHIPTIGIIDTDADPTWVTYPIPANDDSLRCVQLIAGSLSMAAKEGRTQRLEQAKTGRVTYKPLNMEDIRFKD